MGAIGTIVKTVIKRVKYGKKIRINHTNGEEVFKKGNVETTFNKKGRIVTTERTERINDIRTERYRVDFLPFGETRKTQTKIIKDGDHFDEAIVWKDDKYGRSRITIYKNQGNGTITKSVPAADGRNWEIVDTKPFPLLDTRM